MQNPAKHDLHLSALSISRATCDQLEEIGFVRDQFANNRLCVASAYHGTYAGQRTIPDEGFWRQLCQLLLSDTHFAGHLEEERTARRELISVSSVEPRTKARLLPFTLEPVPCGRYKACDIHLGVELSASSRESIETLEALGMISFERYGGNGVRRVYTVTCESDDDGHALYEKLCGIVKGQLGFVGKIKLEMISRYLRYPSDVDGLPIVSRESVARWLVGAETNPD